MTIAITHAFTSAKGDGTDATLVRPSNWNAAHLTSCATGVVIGRQTAGVGVFEELTLTAFMAAALAAVDAPSLAAALGVGFAVTGDVSWTMNPTAPAGWIVYQGTQTIGDATSGATARANADCSALYQLVWNQIADGICPVTGGRGANALADFNAHKPIAMPWFTGRSIIGAGAGGSLTTRVLGASLGEETHVLTVGELATHLHANSLNDLTHTHNYNPSNGSVGGLTGGGGFALPVGDTITGSFSNNSTPMSITNANAGSNTAHNNMQPSTAMWAKVKL